MFLIFAILQTPIRGFQPDTNYLDFVLWISTQLSYDIYIIINLEILPLLLDNVPKFGLLIHTKELKPNLNEKK